MIPTLTAGPYKLRPYGEADLGFLQVASTDPFIPQITQLPARGTPEQLRAHLASLQTRHEQGRGFVWLIDADDGPVGQISMWRKLPDADRASIGYWVLAEHRGKGVITAALRAVTAWGLTAGPFARLELYVEPWNEGSWRAAQRCGFVREGLLREWEEVGGVRKDMYTYGLVRTDYHP